MKMVEVLNRVIFDDLKIGREELRAAIDFDKCEFTDKSIEMQIIKKLRGLGDEKIVKDYIEFVKNREESGEITWEQFIDRLEKADTINSPFGIRFQRFENGFERVFFNTFEFGEMLDVGTLGENRNVLKFICSYNFDGELQEAKNTLHELGINTKCNMQQMIEQIAEKKMCPEDMQSTIEALQAFLPTHYSSQQYILITNEEIESIFMGGADLVPDVGLRDYTIKFTDGQRLECRFAD